MLTRQLVLETIVKNERNERKGEKINSTEGAHETNDIVPDSENTVNRHDGCEERSQLEYKALAGLRKLLGSPEAFFRSSGQAAGVVKALERKDNFLCVLPTGAGKTALFMIPALLEHGKTTVVVSPLFALVKDMERRMNAAGICCIVWDATEHHRGIADHVQIVLVSIEAASSHAFLSCCRIMEEQKQLARVVVDEAHLAITWSRFRPLMHDLVCLRQLQVPMMLLSATVPPSMEHALEVAFGTKLSVIREDTTRRNIKYCIRDVRSQDAMEEEIIDLINAVILNNRVDPKSRAIVYQQDRQGVVELANRIRRDLPASDAEAYHGLLDSGEKERLLKKWRSGRIKVMVATSAFGVGIDYPFVRLVIHRSHSASAIDYVQETGRAGRDGQPAACVLVCNLLELERLANAEGSESESILAKGHREFARMVTASGCIRRRIQAVVDHTPRSCISHGGDVQLCEVCEAEVDRFAAGGSGVLVQERNEVVVTEVS